MKKKTRRRITNSEPRNQQTQRRLRLSRETVRVLGTNDLSEVAGGSWTSCNSTSWPSWDTKAPEV